MTIDKRLVVTALPNYEIGEEIGRGGWGVVLAGRHRELGRNVAIKQLPRAFAADPSVRLRFKDEARLIASLDHPHIVPVYDFVESDGLCLIVMELMPSGTLWDRFTGPGLPVDQACGLMLSASAALHFAHGRGILHRDVKPENFLFSASGVMKLGDFGIAKLLDTSQAGHTLTGQIIGTPAYMAPEQASGEAIGPFTDVYSCAVMLYELLTGELPFVETREPLGQLMQRLTQPPRPITTTRPDVPRDIGLTVMQALARDPADRFPSAMAFGESLARSATIAFGPGWLIRSGVEVLGAQSLVAITSMPVTGAGDDQQIARKTVHPTMTHVRVDDVLVVEPEAGLVAPVDDAATGAIAYPSGPPASWPPPSDPPSVEVPVTPPADDPLATMAPRSYTPAPTPAPEAPAPPPPVYDPPAYPSAPPAPPSEPPPPSYEPPPSQPPPSEPPPFYEPPPPSYPPATPAPAAYQPPPDAPATPDPHAPTIGAPRTAESSYGGGVAGAAPSPGVTPPAVGHYGAGPASAPVAKSGGKGKAVALVFTVLLVVVLFGAGGYLIVKSRDSGGGGAASTTTAAGGGNAPKIDSVKPGPDNSFSVTWSDGGQGGRHYLYAVGENYSNLVATEQSPTEVTLPTSGGYCFVVANNDLSKRSAPNCGGGASESLVPEDLKSR